jgi:hypothetical protein
MKRQHLPGYDLDRGLTSWKWPAQPRHHLSAEAAGHVLDSFRKAAAASGGFRSGTDGQLIAPTASSSLYVVRLMWAPSRRTPASASRSSAASRSAWCSAAMSRPGSPSGRDHRRYSSALSRSELASSTRRGEPHPSKSARWKSECAAAHASLNSCGSSSTGGSCARSARFLRRTARSTPNPSRSYWRSFVPGWPRIGEGPRRRCAATASEVPGDGEGAGPDGGVDPRRPARRQA